MKLELNFLILFIIGAFSSVHGQELDSIAMSFEDGKVIVKYDFLEGEEGVDYELYLFGSHDNFMEPLQYTTGDVGKRVQIGTGKVIYWDAKTELGNFKGDFSLKIKGAPYIPFVDFSNISSELKIKRGESFKIEWESSEKVDQVLLKIQRNGVPISDPLIIDNSGSFSWDIPTNLKAGKGYTVQILDTKNLLREETSEGFVIRRKIPLTYKIIPAALIAGTVAYFIFNQPEEGIPGPPDPPQ